MKHIAQNRTKMPGKWENQQNGANGTTSKNQPKQSVKAELLNRYVKNTMTYISNTGAEFTDSKKWFTRHKNETSKPRYTTTGVHQELENQEEHEKKEKNTLESGCQWLEKMLLCNDISVSRFLQDVIDILGCRGDKVNTLCLYGMTNTGQSLLAGLIISPLRVNCCALINISGCYNNSTW